MSAKARDWTKGRWSDLPYAALAKYRPPNATTLIMAYYKNPEMLRAHYAALDALPHKIKQALEVIIVDDGSPAEQAAFPPTGDLGVPVSVFRHHLVDVRWNQDACRNLGVEKARTPWVLLTDIDHLLSASALWRVIYGKCKRDCVYRFGRVVAPRLHRCAPHVNSWFMARELFSDAGGYDERFAGWYGSDRDFTARIKDRSRVVALRQPLVYVGLHLIGDASTSDCTRLTPEDTAAIERIKAERDAAGDGPIRQNFPYERVF